MFRELSRSEFVGKERESLCEGGQHQNPAQHGNPQMILRHEKMRAQKAYEQQAPDRDSNPWEETFGAAPFNSVV